jgi:hypothetical protein
MSAAADTDGSGFKSQGAYHHRQTFEAEPRLCCPGHFHSERGAQQALRGGDHREAYPQSETSPVVRERLGRHLVWLGSFLDWFGQTSSGQRQLLPFHTGAHLFVVAF